MASTKIRKRGQRYTDKTVFNGVAIASNSAPLDDKVLAFNSTSGYFEYTSATTVGETIPGNANFIGTFQVGADGNFISQLDHGVTDVITVGSINAGAEVTGTVNFSITFNNLPIVVLGIDTVSSSNDRLVANITNITTMTFSWSVYNSGVSATSGVPIRLYWFAILGF